MLSSARFFINTNAIDLTLTVPLTSPPSSSSSQVVFNPIPGDFTKLNSFGGASGLKQYMLPEGADLVDESLKGDTFSIEYVFVDPSSSLNIKRHVFSTFALRPAEVVVGLTVQTPQDDFEVGDKAKV